MTFIPYFLSGVITFKALHSDAGLRSSGLFAFVKELLQDWTSIFY